MPLSVPHKLFAGAAAALTLTAGGSSATAAPTSTPAAPVTQTWQANHTGRHHQSATTADQPDGGVPFQPLNVSVTDLPPGGVPAEVTPDGTLVTTLISARDNGPAIVQRTLIANKGQGASWRDTMYITPTEHGALVRENIYTNSHMQVGIATGRVDMASDPDSSLYNFRVTESSPPRVEVNPYVGGGPLTPPPALGETAPERMSKAFQVAFKYGLFGDNGFDTNYVAVAPEPPQSMDDFAHGVQRAHVQVNDWSGEITRNSLTLIGRNGIRIYATGNDLFLHPIYPQNGNFTSLTVSTGNNRVQMEPINRVLDINGTYTNQRAIPENIKPYFAAANLAIAEARPAFRPFLKGYFPGADIPPASNPYATPKPQPARPGSVQDAPARQPAP